MAIFEQHVHDNKTDEWATPKGFIRPLAEAVGGFDLDPCSGAEDKPHAENVYTVEDDGLAQEWFGAVWVNPPFSDKAKWIQKAIEETNRGNADLVVVLLPVDTSTEWFHDLVSNAVVHAFIGPGRQDFDRRSKEPAGGNPSFAIMLAVFGEHAPKELLGYLSRKGIVFYNRSLWKEQNQAVLFAQNGAETDGIEDTDSDREGSP